MAVTGSQPLRAVEIQHQVDKLLNSSVLQSSESLRRLLRYLAEQAQAHPGTPLKEYQIATEVFGRSPDFDPRLDSTVRVQTGRLRTKLAEYYAGPGAEDTLIVEIPRGAYALVVHPRPQDPQRAGDTSPAVPALPVPAPAAPIPARPPNWLLLSLALAAIASAAAAGYFSGVRQQRVAPAPPSLPPALAAFWSRFTEKGDNPVVVFSNAEFVGRPETGMRYYVPGKDRDPEILDHYTGVGEVIAVAELSRLFVALDASLRIKRGRLLSLDDARNNDVIFLGSPTENLILRDIHASSDFVFRHVGGGNNRRGDLAIINVRPKPDELKQFLATPTMPLKEDYAIVSLRPGLSANRWILALAGTTTIGTQAAAEFVCRPNTAEELMQKIGAPLNGPPPAFEAVLRISVAGGVPVKSEIVALRRS